MGINPNHTPTHYDINMAMMRNVDIVIFTNTSTKIILTSAAGPHAHKFSMLTHELNFILVTYKLHYLNTLAIHMCTNDACPVHKVGFMSCTIHVRGVAIK